MKLLMRESRRSIEQRAPDVEEPGHGRIVEKVADCSSDGSSLENEDNRLLGEEDAVSFEAGLGEIVLGPTFENASCLLVGVVSELGDDGYSLDVLVSVCRAHPCNLQLPGNATPTRAPVATSRLGGVVNPRQHQAGTVPPGPRPILARSRSLRTTSCGSRFNSRASTTTPCCRSTSAK